MIKNNLKILIAVIVNDCMLKLSSLPLTLNPLHEEKDQSCSAVRWQVCRA